MDLQFVEINERGMSITKALSETTAHEIATCGASLLTSVEARLLEDGTFLFISAELAADAPLERVEEASRLIRDVVVPCSPKMIDADAWGAVLRYRGKIVNIIHAGNNESSA